MKLDLYKFEGCPYCGRVIKAIEESGRMDVEFHDIRANEADYAYLKEHGGSTQVPCLFIDGTPMYESGDIIEWLSANPQA